MSAAQKTAILAQVGHFYFGAVGQFYVGVNNYLRIGDRGDPALVPRVIAHRSRIRQRPAVQRILEIEGLAAAWTD
jgi:hypothetical protein